MELIVFTQSQADFGRAFRQYQLDGIPTIGVFSNEPYGIRFRNSSGQKVQVKIAVDGTDVLKGDKADPSSYGPMWVVEPYRSMELIAWPEDTRGGARFVFTHADSTVAVHTHGDTFAMGYISTAVFTEGYKPLVYRGGYTTRGGSSKGMEYLGGDTKGGFESFGPGTGAGEYARQDIGNAAGLIQPQFSQIISIHYVWWDDLVRMLQQAGISPTQQYSHPTGFEPRKLADLGNTPRPGQQQAPFTPGYQRFT